MNRTYVVLFTGVTLSLVTLIIVPGPVSPVRLFGGQAGSVPVSIIGILLAFALAVLAISRLSEKRLAEVRKEERKRIAADLHDEIGPRLALVKFQLDALQCPAVETDRARQKAMEDLDELSQKLRGITRDLTTGINRSMLVDKVRDLVAKLKNATGIPIQFEYGLTSGLNEQQNLDCYRLIQETLNNALKHGRASQIFVSIYEEHHRLNITCRDNGKGFDFKSAFRQNSGMGLSNIAWRIQRLKGNFSVDSRPGGGSVFHYQISLG